MEAVVQALATLWPVIRDSIKDLVLPLLAIIGTVYVAWRSATTHYYRQRWWDRKAQTYADLVASLSLRYQAEEQLLRHEMAESLINDDGRKHLMKQIHDANDFVARVNLTAGLFISNECVDALTLMLKEMDRPFDNDWITLHEMNLAALRKALGSVQRIAKQDLKVAK
jgi:hypothetical protein